MEPIKIAPFSQYRSYLLRLWQPEQEADWRIILESVQNGERECFRDLGELLAGLERHMQALEAVE